MQLDSLVLTACSWFMIDDRSSPKNVFSSAFKTCGQSLQDEKRSSCLWIPSSVSSGGVEDASQLGESL